MSWLSVVFLWSQAALQKQQQQADLVVQGTLDSSSFNSGDSIPVSAAGPLCAASPPAGEEAPTVNGGQSDSYSESMDREPEPEPAEEVSENGPLLGWWAVVRFKKTKTTDWLHADRIYISLIVRLMAEVKQTKLYTKWKPDSYLLCPCWCDLEGRAEKSWNKWYMIACWFRVSSRHTLCLVSALTPEVNKGLVWFQNIHPEPN